MSLRELYQLQELDWITAEKRQTLDAVRTELADDSDLRRARLRLARLETEYSSQNALRRDAQLVVEQLEAREQVVQSRLYGGAVTNPRELEAFQEEQAILLRQKSEAEDTLLEHMITVEELQESLAGARNAVAAIEEHLRQRVPALRTQERSLSEELEALQRQRAALLPQFSPQMLSIYETLLSSRDGYAVSKVELTRGREICEACRVALPRSDIQRLRTDDSLVQCNNCRRILFVE